MRSWLIPLWMSVQGAVACAPSESASPPPVSAEEIPMQASRPSAVPVPATGASDDDGNRDAGATTEVVVSAGGCVADMKNHAVELALTKYPKELEEALGRTARSADFGAESCASVSALGDLDGDGASDSDVSLCLPPGGHVWIHYLYLSNRGCTKAAEPFMNGELTVLDSKSHGVKDLEAIGANGCAGADFTWTLLRWDGKAYRPADTATCHFCTEVDQKPPAGANRDAYCKKEQARRKKLK